jgi:hypothetical protein
LDDKLILSHVVAVLEDDRILGSVNALEVKKEREEVGFKDGTFLGDQTSD